MVRCPACSKVQVVYVQAPARTSCYYCDARWVQQGAEQEGVIATHAPESALRSMGHRRTEPTSALTHATGAFEALSRTEISR
jgi:hypothetical protein